MYRILNKIQLLSNIVFRSKHTNSKKIHINLSGTYLTALRQCIRKEMKNIQVRTYLVVADKME